MGRGALCAPRPIFIRSVCGFVCVYICFDRAEQIFQISPSGGWRYFKYPQQGVEDIRDIWITLLRPLSWAKVNLLIHMLGRDWLDETFQSRSQNSPPNTLHSMHTNIFICAFFSLCYVRSLVDVMCRIWFVLCAWFGLCYVQSLVCVMCSL